MRLCRGTCLLAFSAPNEKRLPSATLHRLIGGAAEFSLKGHGPCSQATPCRNSWVDRKLHLAGTANAADQRRAGRLAWSCSACVISSCKHVPHLRGRHRLGGKSPRSSKVSRARSGIGHRHWQCHRRLPLAWTTSHFRAVGEHLSQFGLSVKSMCCTPSAIPPGRWPMWHNAHTSGGNPPRNGVQAANHVIRFFLVFRKSRKFLRQMQPAQTQQFAEAIDGDRLQAFEQLNAVCLFSWQRHTKPLKEDTEVRTSST